MIKDGWNKLLLFNLPLLKFTDKHPHGRKAGWFKAFQEMKVYR